MSNEDKRHSKESRAKISEANRRRVWREESKEKLRAAAIINSTKHGMHGTQEWHAWKMMKQRCNNPNYPQFKYWGGKGITICERWNNSFIAFFEDMGMKPSPEYSLDRINGNGNYEPGNCRWATPKEQQDNHPHNNQYSKGRL